MTHTSVMEAITSPSRWSMSVVDIFFGEVRVRRNQTIAMSGDILRDDRDGTLWVFRSRLNDKLILDRVEQPR